MNESVLHDTTQMNLTITLSAEARHKSVQIIGLQVYEVQEQVKVNCADRHQHGGTLQPEDLTKGGQDEALWEYQERSLQLVKTN